jgi:hypothetical protein
VTSDDLTPDQLADLAAHCARHRDYLTRLRDRMQALKFPSSDPLYTAVCDAWAATSNLTVVAASKGNRQRQPPAQPPPPPPQDGPPWAGHA